MIYNRKEANAYEIVLLGVENREELYGWNTLWARGAYIHITVGRGDYYYTTGDEYYRMDGSRGL